MRKELIKKAVTNVIDKNKVKFKDWKKEKDLKNKPMSQLTDEERKKLRHLRDQDYLQKTLPRVSKNKIVAKVMEKFAPERPPKKWMDEQIADVKKQNPGMSEKSVRAIAADRWWKAKPSTKKYLLNKYEV
jgi:hypothetical protein